MGFASIIATALGIILLIVTAYVLVSGVLVASETVVAAQKDMTAIQVEMLGTSLEITNTSLVPETNSTLLIEFSNTGNEPIRDFDKMDIYLKTSENMYHFTNPSHWTLSIKQLNPGQRTSITFDPGLIFSTIQEVRIITPNGIPASWAP